MNRLIIRHQRARRSDLTPRLFGIFLLLGLAILPLGDRMSALAGDFDPDQVVPGEYLVKFKDSVSTRAGDQLIAEMGATKIKKFDRIGVWHLEITNKSMTEVLDRYRKNASIEYIEPNVLFQLDATVNDPLFPQQWNLYDEAEYPGDHMGDGRITHAWDVTMGSRDIIVGIIDGRIEVTHPDLNGQMFRNENEIPLNGIDDDNNGHIDDYYGLGHQGQYSLPINVVHGTHVASIVGSSTDNELGVAGVCPNVTIMQLYTNLVDKGLSADGILNSIFYAIDNGAHIVNCSFSSDEYSQGVYDAYELAGNAGIYAVCSTGNNEGLSDDNDVHPRYPCSFDLDNIIAVTGTSRVGNQSGNYGLTSVDIGAPLSALAAIPQGQYDWLAGTSMSTPFVSGVMALMMSKYGPDSGMDFKARLLESVDHLESLEGKCVSEGRVNGFLAVADPDNVAPGAIADFGFAQVASNWLELEWTATGDDGASGQATLYEFRISTDPIVDQAAFDTAIPLEGLPLPAPSGTTQRLTVDGLEQGTTYYIAAQVYDEWGVYNRRVGEDYTANISWIANAQPVTTLGAPEIVVNPAIIAGEVQKWSDNTLSFEIANAGVGTLDYQITIPEEYAFVSGTNYVGSVTSGGQATITLIIDADGLPCGDVAAAVEISSNDEANPLVVIPVELQVSGSGKLEDLPGDIDFGPVVVGQSAVSGLTLNNLGCDQLEIIDISSDNPVVSVYGPSVIPGETSLSAALVFTPPEVGEYQGILNLRFMEGGQEVVRYVQLSGVGATDPAIVLSHETIETPLIYTGGSHVETLNITNTGGVALTVLPGWGNTLGWLSVPTEGLSIEPGETFGLPVTFLAAGQCESQSGTLVFKSNDPDHLTIEIPVTMNAAPGAHAAYDDNGLDWGVQGNYTRPVRRYFEIENQGCDGCPLTITGIVSSRPDVFAVVSSTPVTILPGQTGQIAVSLQVGVPDGDYDELLSVVCDDPDQGTFTVPLTAVIDTPGTPPGGDPDQNLSLDLGAFPNPFNPMTEIRFNLNRESRIKVRLFDIRGRAVKVIDMGQRSAGPVRVTWNGTDRHGSRVATGVYFYQVLADGRQLGETSKLMLVK